tara:strand:+ start:82 stop:216 length:135 start_codon:yes stop_codon:yes gene_type:complete
VKYACSLRLSETRAVSLKASITGEIAMEDMSVKEKNYISQYDRY